MTTAYDGQWPLGAGGDYACSFTCSFTKSSGKPSEGLNMEEGHPSEELNELQFGLREMKHTVKHIRGHRDVLVVYFSPTLLPRVNGRKWT